MVGAVPDDKELLSRNSAALHQCVVDRKDLRSGEMVVARKLLRVRGRVVGVAFDANDLVRKIATQLGRYTLHQLVSTIFQIVTTWHKNLIASDLDTYNIAILSY